MAHEFWLNKDRSSNNIIALSDTAIYIASIDEEVLLSVKNQLSSEKPLAEVLGNKATTIPYTSINGVTSRDTDDDIEIAYRAGKNSEEESLFFDSHKTKADALAAIERYLPENLQRSITKQNVVSAGFYPLLAIVVIGWLAYLFYPLFAKTSLVVGGLCLLVAVSVLIKRLSNPPVVTRWVIKGKYLRKFRNLLGKGFAILIWAAVIIVLHDRLSESFGPGSLMHQYENGELEARDVQSYIKNGADVDYADEDGDTLLLHAASSNDFELTKALIDNGAEINYSNTDGSTAMHYAVQYGDSKLIELLIAAGADPSTKDNQGYSAMDYARQSDNKTIISILRSQ